MQDSIMSLRQLASPPLIASVAAAAVIVGGGVFVARLLHRLSQRLEDVQHGLVSGHLSRLIFFATGSETD